VKENDVINRNSVGIEKKPFILTSVHVFFIFIKISSRFQISMHRIIFFLNSEKLPEILELSDPV